MFRILILSCSLTFCLSVTHSQSCLPNGIKFTSQEQINAFPATYPNCIEIEGYVKIKESAPGTIINLDSLQQITRIGGSLSLSSNSELSDISGLTNLTYIGGSLTITIMGALPNLKGLDNLEGIGLNLSIFHNNSITDLSGLENLSSIGSHLHIEQNFELQNLNALTKLTNAGGYLEITFNNKLLDISGLENLTSVGSYIRVRLNNLLTSLYGLHNIDPNTIVSQTESDDLVMVYNPALSDCAVESICLSLAMSETSSTFIDNGDGCNSQEEVLSHCTTNSINGSPPKLILFPNPISKRLHIKSLSRNDLAKWSIYNFNGKKVMEGRFSHQEVYEIQNLDLLPEGFYFLKINSRDSSLFIGKIQLFAF